MSFADELKRELRKQFPKDQVKFAKGWRTRGDKWLTGNGRPVGSLHHHTAGGSANRNPGVVAWCIAAKQSHGWCNAVIDRDGTVFIVGVNAQWHAGLGSFAGTRWEKLGIGRDMGNRHLWGTELVDPGKGKTITKAQKQAMAKLDVCLRAACGWPGFKLRVMNHKDWTSRKSDTNYSWGYWLRRARAAWLTRAR